MSYWKVGISCNESKVVFECRGRLRPNNWGNRLKLMFYFLDNLWVSNACKVSLILAKADILQTYFNQQGVDLNIRRTSLWTSRVYDFDGHKVQILLDSKMDLSHLDKLKNGLMKKIYGDDHKKVACISHCLKIT